MIRKFIARLLRIETRAPLLCTRESCSNYKPGTIHYHYGYGQRHDDLVPHTGPNDFSSGQPFIRSH